MHKALMTESGQSRPHESAPSATRCWRASRRPPTMARLPAATSSSKRCSRIARSRPRRSPRRRRSSATNAIFASNTSTLPITSLAGRVQGPDALHRHPFLLAGRAHDAGRGHPRQADRRQGARGRARLSCAPSARRRSWSTTSRGFYANRCVLALTSAGRPPDADRRRAAGHDRERRAHGRHAGRAAVAQRRGGARSRPGRSSRRPKPISAPEAIDPRQKAAAGGAWWRNAAASAARTARASTTIRRAAEAAVAGPCRIAAEEARSGHSSTSRNSSSACWRCRRWRPRARFEERVHHRRARGRCRLDPRLRLCAVLRRHAVLYRHDGHEAFRRAVPAAGEEVRRALRTHRSCCSTWPPKNETFYGRFAPARSRKRRKARLSSPANAGDSNHDASVEPRVPAFAGDDSRLHCAAVRTPSLLAR